MLGKVRAALHTAHRKASQLFPDSCSQSSCQGSLDQLNKFTALLTNLGVIEGIPSQWLCFSYQKFWHGSAMMINLPGVPEVPKQEIQDCSTDQSCPSSAHPLSL